MIDLMNIAILLDKKDLHHNDIKPANIVVSKIEPDSNLLKIELIDFGEMSNNFG